MRGLSLFMCLLLAPLTLAQPQLNVMPMPSSFQLGSGRLLVNQSFTVALTGYKDRRLERGVQRFLSDLSRQTGMPLKAKIGDSADATLVIHAEHGNSPVQQLGEDESYS